MRYLLVVQHAERFGRHAVDAPFRVPMLVAYRDGEPAVVGPYQVNQLPLAALDLQRFTLAGVCGVVPLCNKKRDFFLFKFLVALVFRLKSAVTRMQLHVAIAAATRGGPNVEIIPARSSLSYT